MDTRLTPEQFGQLMNLLNKQNNNKEAKDQAIVNSAHLVGKHCFNVQGVKNWMIENGALDNICFQLNLFHSYKKLDGKAHFITIPIGTQVKVEVIGNVALSDGLNLNDVLYVPSFHFNLIYVNKLVKDLK